MRIDRDLLREVTGILAPPGFECSALGLVNAENTGALTFIDDPRYLEELIANPNISAVLTTRKLARDLRDASFLVLESEDPRWDFFQLLNHLGRSQYTRKQTVIHESASVHPTAYVSDYNVWIGPESIVEPNVTVMPDVVIGSRCTIRCGATIGTEGFEHKRTARGILSVFHDGKAVIGDDVEVGSNSAVCKGFSFRNTTVGDFTKLDTLVYVAHGAQVGARCLLAAHAVIGGSSTIGDDVWIGLSASVSSQVRVGSRARISIGAVATRDVEADQTVSGNFAIAHDRFLRFIRSVR